MYRIPSDPDLAEKLERAAKGLARYRSIRGDIMDPEEMTALAGMEQAFEALAAAHRDRATLDDHQARILPDDPAPSLAPICAELGLSPGEDVGAVVAAIRRLMDRVARAELALKQSLSDFQ